VSINLNELRDFVTSPSAGPTVYFTRRHMLLFPLLYIVLVQIFDIQLFLMLDVILILIFSLRSACTVAITHSDAKLTLIIKIFIPSNR